MILHFDGLNLTKINILERPNLKFTHFIRTKINNNKIRRIKNIKFSIQNTTTTEKFDNHHT